MKIRLHAFLFTVLWLAASAGVAASAKDVALAKDPVAQPVAKPVSPITVNVNVRVSHDTQVDVKIDAPVTLVIGTLQLPDFVQSLLGGLFKKQDPSPAAAPKK